MRILLFIVYMMSVGFMGYAQQDSLDLSVRKLHFGYHSSEIIVDVGIKNWNIETLRVNESFYSIPQETKKAQILGHVWLPFTVRWIRLCHYSPSQFRVLVNTDLREFYQDSLHSFCIYLKNGEKVDSIIGLVEPPREGGEWWPIVSTYQVNFTKNGGAQYLTTERFCAKMVAIRVDGKAFKINVSDNQNLLKNLKLKKTFDWLTMEIVGKKVILKASPNIEHVDRTFELEFRTGYQTTRIIGKQASI